MGWGGGWEGIWDPGHFLGEEYAALKPEERTSRRSPVCFAGRVSVGYGTLRSITRLLPESQSAFRGVSRFGRHVERQSGRAFCYRVDAVLASASSMRTQTSTPRCSTSFLRVIYE